jgi:hypothetical protein
VRSSGDLGGYSLGVARKIGLLSAEGIEIIGGKVLDFERVLFLFQEKK